MTMTRTAIQGLALAAALVTANLVTASASAAEPHGAVPQLAAVTTDLGNNATALTYWVDQADGFHVVTTIDTGVDGTAALAEDRHAVVRFSAPILPGQSQVISVPGSAGPQAQALRIRRFSNHDGRADIQVDSVPATTAPWRSSLVN
jgi:hypothetical protein